MIAKITRTSITYYRDNEQRQACVEWIDTRGKTGRTTGDPRTTHMEALIKRGEREGIYPEREVVG